MSRLSNTALKSTLSALHYSGLGALFAPWTRGVGAILMLHQVNPQPVAAFEPNRILRVTPDFLGAAIRHCLELGYDFVSMDELRARLLDPVPGRRYLSVTLDDAYRDNLTYAVPIFRRYGVPFTIYAPVDYLDGGGELWWLAFERVLAIQTSIDLDVGGRKFSKPLRTTREKDAAFHNIYWHLRTIDEVDARRIVRELCDRNAIDLGAQCKSLVMSWDEIRDIAADPLATIGAHTCRHVAMAHLTTDDARTELTRSIARIEQELGKPCRHFSYPYGDSLAAGPRDFDIAREVGVATAVTTRKGLIHQHHASSLTSLPRLSMNGDYQQARYLKVLLDGAPFSALGITSRLKSRLALTTPTARP
jgi:peptidoglycan/xylan/chitin deacetylase (PgdA/CDA1 family)